MAKFICKRTKFKIQIKPEVKHIVNDGIFSEPAKIVEAKNGVIITDDPEVIARIRSDKFFGTKEIMEITEADERAIKIKNRKLKEAQIEIDNLNKAEVKKTKETKK